MSRWKVVVVLRALPRAADLCPEGSHNITTNYCHSRSRQLIVRHLTTSDYRLFGALSSKMMLVALCHTLTTMISLLMIEITKNQKMSLRETTEVTKWTKTMKRLQKKTMGWDPSGQHLSLSRAWQTWVSKCCTSMATGNSLWSKV